MSASSVVPPKTRCTIIFSCPVWRASLNSEQSVPHRVLSYVGILLIQANLWVYSTSQNAWNQQVLPPQQGAHRYWFQADSHFLISGRSTRDGFRQKYNNRRQGST